MKKIIYLGLCCTFSYNSQAQTSTQVSQLATLGKVWGFLKCFHPAAAKGKPDWDNELLRMIPLTEKAATQKAFDSLLEAWYRSLPVARVSTTPVNWNADSLVRTFTEKDIQRYAISKWLKQQLVQLYQYHLPDTNRYATRYYDRYYYDHIIHDEKAYDKPLCPERPVRLLGLIRYWNTINYFYPHKARLPQWDRVLTGYISRFYQAENETEYQQAVQALIHELKDSHSFITGAGINNNVPPFRIDYVEGKYFIGESDDSVVKKWDYRVGDEIVAVNGQPIADRVKELEKITTGTNALSVHRNIAQGLLKVADSIVPVSFKRNGEVITKPVTLYSYMANAQLPRSQKPLWQELEKGIWYVRYCQIKNADTLRQLFRDIHDAKAVIWEMRGYPNFKVTTETYKFFFPEKTLFAELRNAWDYNPGAFVKSPYYFLPEAKEALIYNGPLIVLIDEHTQSLTESVASALKQRSNTITMGRQTAGTTGNIAWLTMPGAIEVSYTGVGVDLHQAFHEGDGVQLDIPVTLPAASLIQGRDVILEQAVQYARRYK